VGEEIHKLVHREVCTSKERKRGRIRRRVEKKDEGKSKRREFICEEMFKG
jgi:hypothetical protein